MKKKTVCISGGRNYTLSFEGKRFLFKYFVENKLFLNNVKIIQGGAKGIDTSVFKMFEQLEPFLSKRNFFITQKTFPADWKSYGKAAGNIRNAEMAKKTDIGILFPGGSGTNNMFETLNRLHKEVVDVRSHKEFVENLTEKK